MKRQYIVKPECFLFRANSYVQWKLYISGTEYEIRRTFQNPVIDKIIKIHFLQNSTHFPNSTYVLKY